MLIVMLVRLIFNIVDSNLNHNKTFSDENQKFIYKIEEKKRRKDSKGQEIIKGGKNHILVFVDKISSKVLSEIVIIDSYKEFNINIDQDDFGESGNSSSGNICIIY